jgi:hypothetical protein
VIADAELLAACRSAGEPGSESHRLACRLYRQSVLEFQAGSAGWQAERWWRATVGQQVALIAEAAREAGLLGDCGTLRGYKRHVREKTLACLRCRQAEREYRRERYRARKAAAHGEPWQEAA